MSLHVLSYADVERVASTFSPQKLQLLMADVFALASRPPAASESPTAPPAYTPHRITIPVEQHKAQFMPARITAMGTTMKVVSPPTNPNDSRGLPASTIVLDKETGAVKAVVNARKLTALRNAAGSLLSTTLVGPTNPTHIVAYGAGEQISAHLDLHLKVFPGIKNCTIVNRSLNSRVQGLLNKLQSNHPKVDITSLISRNQEDHSKIQNALSTASIIITATSSREPLFPSDSVPTGAHVILIGSYTEEMKEVDRKLVMRAVGSKEPKSSLPRLLVDSTEACLQEAGELIDAGLSTEQMTEIGTLVLRARESNEDATPEEMRGILSSNKNVTEEPGSSFDGPITLFKSVGIGLQDVAIAIAVVEKAKETQGEGLGVLVEDYDKV